MKHFAKRALGRCGLLAATKRHAGARYLRHPPSCMFESVLLRVFADLDGLRFIQVGANDGVRTDPLRRFVDPCHWSGVMIEPLPYNFRALQENCGNNPRIKLIRAAIDKTRGRRRIYDLDPCLQNLPNWAGGLASFSSARLQRAAMELGLNEDSIRSTYVDTITWSDVRDQLGQSEPDLLVVDTEGYDITLLREFDLATHRPRVVHFEHACVELSERVRFYGEILRLGYEIASDAGDTTAWLQA